MTTRTDNGLLEVGAEVQTAPSGIPSGIWIDSSEGEWVDTGIDWTDERVDSVVADLRGAIITVREQSEELRAQILELVRGSISGAVHAR